MLDSPTLELKPFTHQPSTQKKVLNVGGNSKAIALPPQYEGFEHLLLDIDPAGQPDIVCDARNLTSLSANSFDAIYCSHNLEHYYKHDIPKVLAGFLHTLKEGGIAHIIVPDIGAVMRATLERRLDIDDTLYESQLGPITVLDVLYGYGKQIESSGQEFFAHKTGFTHTSLAKSLQAAGFSSIFSGEDRLNAVALAFKGRPSTQTLSLFNLPAA